MISSFPVLRQISPLGDPESRGSVSYPVVGRWVQLETRFFELITPIWIGPPYA